MQRIKSVYEKAAIKNPDNPELATPFRWMFFDDEKLDEWWEEWDRANKG